jgi:threonine-phosphate decarboxylase
VFIKETRKFIKNEKRFFCEAFTGAAGIKIFPSTTVFILARLFRNHTADMVCGYLAQERILIRNCSNFRGLSNRFIRVAFKTHDVNVMLVEKLSRLLMDDALQDLKKS